MNKVYRAFGSHVMVLDLDQPDTEPRFVEGNERGRAFDLQVPNKTHLARCRDGCERFFMAQVPKATLCEPCETSMRNAAASYPADEESTNHNGMNAHELGICHESCDECMYEAAGERGVDW